MTSMKQTQIVIMSKIDEWNDKKSITRRIHHERRSQDGNKHVAMAGEGILDTDCEVKNTYVLAKSW